MQTAQFLEVHPVLPVRSVPQAIAYYVTKLGFRLRFQDAPEEPRYAVVERDRVILHLQWHEASDFRGGEDTAMLRFLIEDIEALYEEYQAQAVFHENTRLRDTPWKTREFAFFDPDGNGMTFYRGL